MEWRYRPGAPLAPMFERQAEELLTLAELPDVGPGGEVVTRQSSGLGMKRGGIRDTLVEGATRIAEDASFRRTGLLLQPSFDAVATGVDAAESIGAANSLEKVLAHQMAVVHEATMRLLNRALSYEAGGRSVREGDSVQACRLANTAVRLMSTFQDGLLTIQRMQTGGNQTVTVQHVQVQPGAQAVVGNVQTAGHRRRGSSQRSRLMPCEARTLRYGAALTLGPLACLAASRPCATVTAGCTEAKPDASQRTAAARRRRSRNGGSYGHCSRRCAN